MLDSSIQSTVSVTAFFSAIEKNFLKPDSPSNILQGTPTSSIYHAIWAVTKRFFDNLSFFLVLHQISRTKKHDTSHSDQRSCWFWVNIHELDKFPVIVTLYITIIKLGHFFHTYIFLIPRSLLAYHEQIKELRIFFKMAPRTNFLLNVFSFYATTNKKHANSVVNFHIPDNLSSSQCHF